MMHQQKQLGFTVLYAVIIVSMITAIGAGVFSLSLRQVGLLSVAKEVSVARNTTDRAIECLMYNDIVSQSLENAGDTVTCDGQQFTAVVSTRTGYDLDVTITHDDNSCAVVSFDADFNGDRRIYARGFNRCGSKGPELQDPGLQEYVYEVVYEGSSPFGRQNFIDTDTDDDTYTDGVAVYDGFLYIATTDTSPPASTAEVRIFSLADPANPMFVAVYPVLGRIDSMLIDQGTLYLAAGGDVHVVNVSTPTNPKKITEVSGVVGATSLYKRGGYLYVSDSGQGLKIFDVSTPASPSLIVQYDPSGSVFPKHLIADDSYAYVCGIRTEFVILDISQLPTVQELGTYNGGPGGCEFAKGIAKKGDYLFASWGGQGFRVLDVSNPASIRHVRTIIPPDVKEGQQTSSPNVRHVILVGDSLYVAASLSFFEYNVADPENPVLVYSSNSFYIGGRPNYLAEYGGHVYAANTEGGVLRYGPSDQVFTNYTDQ